MALSLFGGFQDPFLSDFTRDITRAFDPFIGMGGMGTRGGRGGAGGQLTMYHPMDIIEHNDRYSIIADAPGMTPDDISVELNDNTLVVTGEKSTQKETTDERAGTRVHRNERTFNRFTRSFVLPPDTKSEGITARIDQGVLTVDVPKSEQGARAESKRIRVMGGGAPAHIEAGTAGGGMAGAGMTAGGGAGMGTTTAGAGAVPEAGTPTA